MPSHDFLSFQLNVTERLLLQNGQSLSLALYPFKILAVLVEKHGPNQLERHLLSK